MEENNSFDSSHEMNLDDMPLVQWIQDGWLSNLTTFARCISHRIPVAIDGITRSAIKIMSELDEMEKEAMDLDNESEDVESRHSLEEVDQSDSIEIDNVTHYPLPWEIYDRQSGVRLGEDEVLKRRIFCISLDEKNFLMPFTTESEKDHRTWGKNRNQVAFKLLSQDDSLISVYTKLVDSKAIDEKIFWMNYFYHCDVMCDMRRKELAGYDDELDAEIVQKPPVSCTGFYASSNLAAHTLSNQEEFYSTVLVDDFVVITSS